MNIEELYIGRRGSKTQSAIRAIKEAYLRGESTYIPCFSVEMVRMWRRILEEEGIAYELSARIQKGLSPFYGSRRRLSIITKAKEL
jgi:hypothetical protein